MRFHPIFGLALGACIAVAPLPAPAQPTTARAPAAKAVPVDRVIAIVNDEAITQHDMDDAKRVVMQQMKQQKVQPPAPDVLDKQVLERLITERSLMQYAKETGLRVDDTQIERTIQRIAQTTS
jgi:peptidyl-prolyl cis-trans isomerase SurA